MQARFFVFVLLGAMVAQSVAAKTLIFQTEEPETTPRLDYSQSSESKPIVKTTSKKVAGGVSASSELFFMIEQLQVELGQLRGLVEEQANQIHHLKRNAKSRYRDLDSRVLGLSKKLNTGYQPSANSEAALPTVATPIQSVVPAVVPIVVPIIVNGESKAPEVLLEPTEEQKKAYQDAYALIKAKKFEQAVDSFHSFIEKYPEGKLTGNAYYWLGEVYLVLPQLEQAKQAFTIVVTAFPGHGKVADAMFKLGVSYDRLQDPAHSETYLNEVQQKFPNSTAAKLAKSYKINR